MIMSRIALVTAMYIVALYPSLVLAAPETVPFIVKLNIVGTCTAAVAGSGELDLGTKTAEQVRNGNLISTKGQLNVKCTKGTPYSVVFNNGLNAQSSTRYVKSTTTTDVVSYGLYKDTGTGLPWLATSPLARTAGSSGDVANTTQGQNFDVYAIVPPNQADNLSVGEYRDTVTATVSF